MNKKSAVNFSEEDWKNWLIEKGEKTFFAREIMRWIFSKNILDPEKFPNISRNLLECLNQDFSWSLLDTDSIISSSDGSEKMLLLTHDGLFAECVLMPFENRVTLCVSSQVGCRQGCNFCQTGKLGLTRNLTAGEILSQLLMANKRLEEKGSDSKVTNVVFMGMGEPLDNYHEVVRACKVMIEPAFFCLAKRRVTVSTAGIIPKIRELGRDLPVSLAISLHTADEDQRSRMMPLNKRYPLSELKEALKEYPTPSRQYINIEYVMIRGVNDSKEHAEKLVDFLQGIKSAVNLIPLNKHPGSSMEASEERSLGDFKRILQAHDIHALVRYSRGQDISGACGQLAAKRKHEVDMKPRLVKRSRRLEMLENS